MDTDVELIKPLDSLLINDAYCGFENKDKVALGLGFGVQKGHPLIKAMLEEYENINFINEDGSFNMLPSPSIQTRTLLKYGLKCNNEEQLLASMKIYPTSYFCPMDYHTGKVSISQNTYSIHWFHASWTSSEDKQRIAFERKASRIFGKTLAPYCAGILLNLHEKGMRGAARYYFSKYILHRI